jgi:16S rRNA processing protein RimM
MPGVDVVVDGHVVGSVAELLDAAGGKLLVVDLGGKEVLVPFREPIVRKLDRAARRIEIDPPPGLLDV